MEKLVETPRSEISSVQLEDFVRLYSIALTRYFKKRGCQNATVDDLVQEVFARLLKRTSGGEIHNPEAYIMQTASSVWRDFLRKRQTRAHASHIEYEEESHAVADFSPEHFYEGDEAVRRLLQVLNELPKLTRQVFVLCRLEGIKQRAVALRLGISISSVEKHMVIAITQLAQCFGDER